MNPGSQDRFFQTLARIKHFDNLPLRVQTDLASCARLRCFPAGQAIYLEGEPGQALYLLQSGWVKAIRVSPDGREQALLFMQPGEIFGDVAAFAGVTYPGTVMALEPVEAWAIEQNDMLRLLSRHPELALAVIRRLSERVIYFVGLVEDLSLRSVEARLANTLLQHAQAEGGRLVVQRRAWTTIGEMAVRLGTVRDVLARALRTLEQEGLLQVDKQKIVILDPQGLVLRGNS